jgi:hypothetical protein
VNQPIVTLSDLGGNDQMVFVKRFGPDGTFSIPKVPNGSYQLTYWDYEQNMIIDSFNVTVNGAAVDVGTKALVDWWTEVKGSVFIDTNENGQRDPGENGVPQFLVALKQRDNSLLDAGLNSATTDANGDYVLRQSYPITKWMIEEAFNTRYGEGRQRADREDIPRCRRRREPVARDRPVRPHRLGCQALHRHRERWYRRNGHL